MTGRRAIAIIVFLWIVAPLHVWAQTGSQGLPQEVGFFIFMAVGVAWLIGGFAATRYLVAGSTEVAITPIYYVPGILFAPVTMILAFVTWLFQGKA
jgi:hypothetical protein